MALKELLDDQREAGAAIGLESDVVEEIIEAQRTEVIDIGPITIKTDDGGTRQMNAWRGHSGPENSLHKGGTRLTLVRPEQDVRELPVEMVGKSAIGGLFDAYGRLVSGGKTVIEADPRTLSHTEIIRTFEGVAEGMYRAGILDHMVSVPAGDMGTNHTDYMDAYALRAHQLNPKDPYWQATITGKSIEQGGLAFRPRATGFGVYRSAEYSRRQKGMEQADVTLSGAGNVGGWAGYFMSQALEDGQQPFRILGYGDRYSTLRVSDQRPGAPGIHIDETIASTILDNPNFDFDPRFAAFNGDKMLALAVALQNKQPNLHFTVTNKSGDILTVPSDIFVAASIGGLLNERAISLVKAPVIVEGANGPTTKDGHTKGLLAGKLFMVDTESNNRGVGVSMVETNGNVLAVKDGTPLPDYVTTKEKAQNDSEVGHDKVSRMQKALDTNDRRKAANAVGMATIALNLGADVDPRFQPQN